jgi:rubrerythrin
MTRMTDEERARRRAKMKAAGERARARSAETDRIVAERAAEHEKAMILRREVGIGLEEACAGRFSNRTPREIAEDAMTTQRIVAELARWMCEPCRAEGRGIHPETCPECGASGGWMESCSGDPRSMSEIFEEFLDFLAASKRSPS